MRHGSSKTGLHLVSIAQCPRDSPKPGGDWLPYPSWGHQLNNKPTTSILSPRAALASHPRVRCRHPRVSCCRHPRMHCCRHPRCAAAAIRGCAAAAIRGCAAAAIRGCAAAAIRGSAAAAIRGSAVPSPVPPLIPVPPSPVPPHADTLLPPSPVPLQAATSAPATQPGTTSPSFLRITSSCSGSDLKNHSW